jgi:PEP-CTERM motif
MSRSKVFARAAVVALLSAGTAWRAEAAITEIDIGINPTFTQTGTTSVMATGGFFSARAFLKSSSDFAGGTLTLPDSSMQKLTLEPDPVFPVLGYSVGDDSLDHLNTLFPFGTYTFTAPFSGGAPSQTESLDYTASADAGSIPTLDAGTFTGLQGLKASSGFEFDFNAFEPGSNPDASGLVFLNVLDSSDNAVFSTDGLVPTTTSIFMPRNTLAAGQDYTFDLIFDNRISGTNTDGLATTLFFDSHTDGSFSTAVPEPATWTMMILGFGGLGLTLRRRAAKTRAVFA